jgi:hypothetical protein
MNTQGNKIAVVRGHTHNHPAFMTAQAENRRSTNLGQKVNYGQKADGTVGLIDTNNPTPDEHVPFIASHTGDASRHPPEPFSS